MPVSPDLVLTVNLSGNFLQNFGSNSLQLFVVILQSNRDYRYCFFCTATYLAKRASHKGPITIIPHLKRLGQDQVQLPLLSNEGRPDH